MVPETSFFQRRAKIAKNTFEVKFPRTESPASSGVCVATVHLCHEVFHLPRVVDVKVATGHPPQGRQCAAHTQRLAQVPGQGPDVGPFAATDGHIHIQDRCPSASSDLMASTLNTVTVTDEVLSLMF